MLGDERPKVKNKHWERGDERRREENVFFQRPTKKLLPAIPVHSSLFISESLSPVRCNIIVLSFYFSTNTLNTQSTLTRTLFQVIVEVVDETREKRESKKIAGHLFERGHPFKCTITFSLHLQTLFFFFIAFFRRLFQLSSLFKLKMSLFLFLSLSRMCHFIVTCINFTFRPFSNHIIYS